MSAVQHLPPERFTVVGHARAREIFAAALDDAWVHPAWLLSGPRGIGKAQLGLQWALAALGADRGSENERAALAGAHPDFLWIGRGESGDIPVAAIQKVVGFFGRRAAMGGMRVVVVDAVDDLNRFGVNALLKTLEEPPPCSLIFLIHHRQKRLPATLISRCLHLAMSPLSDRQMREVAGDIDPVTAGIVAGRPAMAREFADSVSACIAATRRVLAGSASERKDLDTVLGAASGSIEAIETVVFRWCRDKAFEADSAADAGRWAEVHASLGRIRQDRRELMLDPSQAAMMMLELIRQTESAIT